MHQFNKKVTYFALGLLKRHNQRILLGLLTGDSMINILITVHVHDRSVQHVGTKEETLLVFSKRQRITLRLLYAIGRPSVVCLSVCL